MMAEAQGHVSDMLIASYLDRRMSDADREQFENHLAECQVCRSAVIEARSLLHRLRPPWRVNAIVGVLAAALIVVAIDLKVQQRNDLSGEPTRAAATTAATITPYGPIGDVRRTGLRFVWSSLPNAISYKVVLVDANSQPLWSSAAADTSIALPPSVSLLVGENYFWGADALASDGTTHTTGLHEFRISQ
jgi:anti-sigma factor RsiW